MRVVRDRISRDEGVAAVEFALILPVLALLLFGVLEFGRVWSQYQVFQGAAREGARCAAVQASGFSDCDIQPAINNAADALQTVGPKNADRPDPRRSANRPGRSAPTPSKARTCRSRGSNRSTSTSRSGTT